MNDMSSTIVAKSDQINAADLIGISRTITIKEVRIKAGEDQPVTIMIEGDNKAFRPCKGVRRLLVRVWGADANKYIGQSLTIFCDPTVTWAGKEEGGIRVSHMTGLDEKIVEYMRTSRTATKPYEILPLKKAPKQNQADGGEQEWADKFIANVKRAPDSDKLDQFVASKAEMLATLATTFPDLHKQCFDAIEAKRRSFLPADDEDPFGEPAPETTDFSGFITGIETRIANATDAEDIDAILEDLREADHVPEAEIARLEAAALKQRREIGKK